MKSLTEADIMQWISRTEKLLTEYQPGGHPIGVYGDGAKPIPPDLERLKIIRIDVLEDQVGYVWMGGMDHTELIVRRSPDGAFTLIARYNDARSEVIWPKRPNQAMQLTASKPVVYTFSACRRARMLRGMHRGLAAADFVSR
jgi:hypothetical protein